MSSRQLNKPNTFAYLWQLDPSARMQRHFGVRGIPHCVVISPDGKVRWQGHPQDWIQQSWARLLKPVVGLVRL